jgi:hypothetical protein
MTRAIRAAALTAAVVALSAGAAAWAATAAPAVPAAAAAPAAVSLPAPVHQGTLRISGQFHDGSTVVAGGLSWRPPALPAGWKLVSFEVATANRAGATAIRFAWRVVPLPGPVTCRSSSAGGCWYPQHLAADGQPMSWDWQIGRVTPLQRTGASAVDLYDLDGFVTTRPRSPPSGRPGRRPPCRTPRWSATSTWPGRTTARTRHRARAPSPPAPSASCTTGTRRSGGSTSGSSAQLQGSTQYGITCTSLQGAAPCGWTDFSTDKTGQQPSGKWVGEAEYTDDDYVCAPGQQCPAAREFVTFCQVVEKPSDGFAAVLFDADLDGAIYDICRRS